MSKNKEVRLSAQERMMVLVEALQADPSCFSLIEDNDSFEQYRVEQYCSKLLASNDVYAIITCLPEYVGVIDAREMLSSIFFNEQNVNLSFGKATKELTHVCSELKEKLALYTVRYGFCQALDCHDISGMIFYIDLLLYVDGKSHIVTIYQGGHEIS